MSCVQRQHVLSIWIPSLKPIAYQVKQPGFWAWNDSLKSPVGQTQSPIFPSIFSRDFIIIFVRKNQAEEKNVNITAQDCLKKALLDTQERVRDFMNYSQQMENKNLKKFFKEFAEMEGLQAQKLQGFIEKEGD